ncbi:MAG: ATP-binding protein, partial [Firmicutes bacterium]|nr:ATP-binding protein [Bacillota bacterium]
MFIGRERELTELNRLYNTDIFQFTVIYGRRRVGKTAIIREFIKGKNSIMFTGVETNAKQNLENFSTCVMSYRSMPADGDKAASYAGESLTGRTGSVMTIQEEAFAYASVDTDGLRFTSFQAALEHVFRLAEKERIVLAIDEYPYIAKDDRSLGSTLQMLIDKYKDTSKLFLILCGSSMSYMEDHVLAYKAPLYGRRTAQFRVEPFDFFEVCRFFSEMTAEDKAVMYGITGGTPQYLLQMNASLTPEENIKNTYLNTSSVLFEEPANLL